MGPYSFIPTMECFHGVGSLNHFLSGSLEIEEETYNFSGGKGYIEKDWGRSFPEKYIWLQANSFKNSRVSVMFSLAKVPWKGHFFLGFLCFFSLENKQYYFTTYNRAQLIKVVDKNNTLYIELKKGSYSLCIRVDNKEGSMLLAPDKGRMNRRIKESIHSDISVLFKENNQILFDGKSIQGGFELINGILDLL